MMFSISLFLQQYLQNIYYGKFFILTICAIVLKIYELAIPVYNRTRQKEKSKECAQQYSQIYQMFWYMITTTHNISSKYVFGRTTYYYGKHQFYMYHANRQILYKKTMILVLKYSLTIPTSKVLLRTLMNLQLFYKFQKNKYVKILESKIRDSDKYSTHLQNIF